MDEVRHTLPLARSLILTFIPQLGVLSHQRASAAQKSGRLASEIIPFHTRLVVPPTDASGEQTTQSVIITEDDGIRHNAIMENFAKAKSAFPQWGEGKSTGPNSSQVTDGGAGIVLMKRSKAQVCGLDWLVMLGRY